ncbi:MAG TPA: hypothetical protein VFD01_14990 [Candidatus Dormibacteraeota bacterium]|jgi:hypothetical protein|nr:hypothetical protein [Candidatus Dormibacteraeota bacterium]
MMASAPLLHGFGARYDLPIPLALYLYAAGGVVVLSFALVAAFASSKVGEAAVRFPRLPAPWLAAALRSGIPRAVAGTLGVLALLAVIVCGWAGSEDPTKNPAEYLTWIYFWAGLVIVSGLVGNLYTLFNPWSAVYDLLSRVRSPGPRFRLPNRVGIWPAVAGYWLFAGFELASGLANRPWVVATLALGYSLYTLAGMVLFGRDQWLRRCETFTVLFGIVERFSPVEVEMDLEGRVGAAWLRPWGTGLLTAVVTGWDWIVFVILMLSSLAFDGIEATPGWLGLQATLVPSGDPLQLALVKWFAGLTLVTFLFLAVFVAIMRLVTALGQGRDWLALTTAFAFTLVPIALVYNAAHNYSYLLVQSQGLFPLLDDPLGRGWHLLPALSAYRASWALAGAGTVWYLQVILIVVGHVIAVWLSHLRAGERFRSTSRVIVSQYPMLALMVAYTMTSLWILAQPITREG